MDSREYAEKMGLDPSFVRKPNAKFLACHPET